MLAIGDGLFVASKYQRPADPSPQILIAAWPNFPFASGDQRGLPSFSVGRGWRSADGVPVNPLQIEEFAGLDRVESPESWLALTLSPDASYGDFIALLNELNRLKICTYAVTEHGRGNDLFAFSIDRVRDPKSGAWVPCRSHPDARRPVSPPIY